MSSIVLSFFHEHSSHIYPSFPVTKMPIYLLKNRLLFFVFVMILQLAIHVAIGLSMYATYNIAKCILLKLFDLLPCRVIANLWQIGLIFVVLG